MRRRSQFWRSGWKVQFRSFPDKRPRKPVKTKVDTTRIWFSLTCVYKSQKRMPNPIKRDSQSFFKTSAFKNSYVRSRKQSNCLIGNIYIICALTFSALMTSTSVANRWTHPLYVSLFFEFIFYLAGMASANKMCAERIRLRRKLCTQLLPARYNWIFPFEGVFIHPTQQLHL